MKDSVMDNKRDKIIESARKRFRYYGIKKTTMQEVADDTGVAVGTLYLYFKDKDDLVIACAEDFVARHRRQAEEITASKAPAEDKLRRYVLTRFRATEETRTSSRHAAELAREVLRVKPDRLRDEGMMMWEYIVRILKLGIEAGEFQIDNPEEDAKVFVYSIAYFLPNALTELKLSPRKEDLLVVVNWFIGVWKQHRGACEK
jgi:AcrR family transcriptional regulator